MLAYGIGVGYTGMLERARVAAAATSTVSDPLFSSRGLVETVTLPDPPHTATVLLPYLRAHADAQAQARPSR